MLEQVGRYKVLSQLGKGAMGVVYLADDPLLSRQVAIKTIDLSIDDSTRREFLRGCLLRDARAAASLCHPNIVAVYDVVEEPNSACIVMEYVEGETLNMFMARNPVTDSQFTVKVVRAMAAALDYTHSRGVIHRDIKPANVMMVAARIPKITDFGIARLSEGATTTMTGAVMGTIEYMSPEQIKGEAVDGRADQFALAVITYRMLTGGTLYGDHSMATLAYKIVNEPPAPVRKRNSWLPSAVDPVVAKALSKDPKDRYRTCTEFADALASSLADVDRDAPTVEMPIPHVGIKRNSRMPLWAGLAAAAVAVAGVTAWRPWTHPVQQVNAATAVVAKPVVQPNAQAVVQPVAQPQPSLAGQTAAAAQAVPPNSQPALADPVAVKKTIAPGEAAAAQKPAPKAKVLEAKVEPIKRLEPVLPQPATEPVPEPQVPAASADPAMDAFNRGRDLMKANQFSDAVQAFSKAADVRPTWAQAYVSRGNAYRGLEQYDAAIRDYSRALRIDPKNFQALLGRGQVYVRQEQDDAALADLNQAIALKADSQVALVARGGIYVRRKNFQGADADFSEAIRLSPDNANAYRGRAAARRGMGDRGGAQADSEKAKEIAEKKGEKGG